MFDTLIVNGTVLDGTGSGPFEADIALLDGKVAKIVRRGGGSALPEARRRIDAGGCYVTPGFIDAHRHDDAVVFKAGYGEIQIRQGVTACINGNCGLSAAPAPAAFRADIAAYLRPITGSFPDIDFATFAGYIAAVKKQKLPLGFGALVGNGTLRMSVKGFAAGPLDAAERSAVQRSLADALEAGALGVSMGLAYIPEIFYDRASLVELLAPLRGGGRPIVTHIRGEGNMLFSAIEEVIGIAEELSVPLHVSHYKCLGKKNWGALLEKTTARIRQAAADGLTVSMDVYPWTAGSTQLAQLLPPEFLEGGAAKTAARLADPAQRARCRAILSSPDSGAKYGFENQLELIGWENVMVSSVVSEKNKPYVGMRIPDIAVSRNVDPFDAAFDILVDENCEVSMVNFIADENDVIAIMNYPESCIISDSIYSDKGNPHPRQHGTFAKLLAEYVRDRKCLTLEQAIHKITGKPAQIFNLAGKGFIKEGYDADIAVFDLAQIENHATYTDPRRLATGFAYVLVGGEIVNDHDTFINAGSGGLLCATF